MRTLLSGIVPVDALPMVVQMIALGEVKGKVRYAVVTETAGGPLVDGLEGDRVGLEQAILSMEATARCPMRRRRRRSSRSAGAGADARHTRRTHHLVHRPGARAAPDPRRHRAPAVRPRRVDVPRRHCRGGQGANAERAAALSQSPKPTAFIDPEAKKLMGGSQ